MYVDRLGKGERLGGGEIGYDKNLVQDLKRYEVPRYAYHESVGDYWAAKAWDFEDDQIDFIKARKAYQVALSHSPSGTSKERLQTKHDNMLKERDEWQREAIRRQELLKAEEEAKNARLQKELTQRELAALKELSGVKEELQTTMDRLRNDIAALGREIRSINRALKDMEEDIEDLEARWRRRPTVLIYDLRRSHDSLRHRLDEMEREMRRDQTR